MLCLAAPVGNKFDNRLYHVLVRSPQVLRERRIWSGQLADDAFRFFEQAFRGNQLLLDLAFIQTDALDAHISLIIRCYAVQQVDRTLDELLSLVSHRLLLFWGLVCSWSPFRGKRPRKCRDAEAETDGPTHDRGADANFLGVLRGECPLHGGAHVVPHGEGLRLADSACNRSGFPLGVVVSRTDFKTPLVNR